MIFGADLYLNLDLWVELFSFFVAFIIATFSFYAFLVTKQRRQRLFSIAFLMLSGGLLLDAYVDSAFQIELTSLPFRGYLPIEYVLGLVLLASMLLTIAGYITLFIITEKIMSKKIMFLLYLLSVFSVIVAHEFSWVFYIVQLILTLFLFIHFVENYQDNRSTSALLVMLAFGGLLLAQLLFTFFILHYVFYLMGTIIRLLSFLLFLTAMITIYLKK